MSKPYDQMRDMQKDGGLNRIYNGVSRAETRLNNNNPDWKNASLGHPIDHDPKFRQGERVYWDPEKAKIPVGAGVVCGIAVNELPGAGRGIIVNLGCFLSDEYPYDHVMIFESLLSKERKKPLDNNPPLTPAPI